MRVLIFWRDNTDYARAVIEWNREFKHRTSKEPESIDPDTREGWDLVRKYDIVRYPTLIALADDGRELQRWDGESLPLINDVSYYLQG